ncbi:hypothetical protein HD554DRAFT_2325555 [Boletus coccyginus]|nr:hypothetical protein HD554DRAFT_2325555 [Boletus coccyginus]
MGAHQHHHRPSPQSSVKYFRYMMLSHKWEENEPLFQQVIHMAVHDLEKSPTHDKLQMFCKIVQDAGFDWAWSDTCCIDKSEHLVFQEALVAMFKWYQRSAMMIVFLRGVRPSQRGALVKSIWNTVLNGPATSHLQLPIPDAEMEGIMAASQTCSFDLDVAVSLFDRLNELPAPWFAASRMKLPCIAFQLLPLSLYRSRSGRVYRVDTSTFGTVTIKTRHDLSWMDSLLERNDKIGAIVGEDVAPPPSPTCDDEGILGEEIDDFLSLVEFEPPSQPPPARMVPMDREMRARRLVAHLRQPFGALLVTLASTGRRAVDYRRVVADSVTTVRFQENVESLADILNNVRTLDIL